MSDPTPGPAGDGAGAPADSMLDGQVSSAPGGEAGAADDAAPGAAPGAESDGAASEQAVEHDIEVLLAEREQFRDIALRLQADFENYRKRVVTQQSDAVDRATGKMAESLLPVLDACEAAFLRHPAEVEPLFNLLLGELRKLGLESLDLHDRPFDPTVAEAVVHEPGDGDGEPVVAEVLRSGYTWKGKVLRPAMVKVRG